MRDFPAQVAVTDQKDVIERESSNRRYGETPWRLGLSHHGRTGWTPADQGAVKTLGRRRKEIINTAERSRPLRALTPSERAVVQYAALGHAFKYIAYELGISVASAASLLRSAMRKLGLKTRVDLIRVFSAHAFART